jgi:hypothetical protein
MAVKVANMKTTHLKGNWSVPLAAQPIRNSAAPKEIPLGDKLTTNGFFAPNFVQWTIWV